MLDHSQSNELFDRAQNLMPGGVSSPVRAFRAVGGQPLFIERGEGATIYDVDGNRYIDYVLSWGPLILGHAHPDIVSALQQTAAKGSSYGAPSPLEIELAELIMSFISSIEMLRFVNSGTEATMSVLRLARAFSGRSKIIKFIGNYHGHADMLLVQAGSGVATLGLPDSPGVPAATVSDTLSAVYNDADSVARLFERFPDQIAAVIVEPVAGNMGLVPPVDGFLQSLRDLTESYNALLIFDEVMTGFRVHPGGAQTLYGIRPDLTALGKVIGGGLPVGAYGGRREIMEMVAPLGSMYQAGTLSGNPLAMAAGIATLKGLQTPGIWEGFETHGNQLLNGLNDIAASANIPVVSNRIGSMFGMFFSEQAVTDWDSAKTANTERFSRYFNLMLDNGIYLAPSQFEAGFLSTRHGSGEIATTLAAAEYAFSRI
ncbi:MAG: glutamate-1-semialdehyde 2,1-aminomutase [Chloroflexi bacterium]|nr:glutamate-1-semialdehyde 2,1-aminomutase [Chloroflexota bacterium]